MVSSNSQKMFMLKEGSFTVISFLGYYIILINIVIDPTGLLLFVFWVSKSGLVETWAVSTRFAGDLTNRARNQNHKLKS